MQKVCEFIVISVTSVATLFAFTSVYPPLDCLAVFELMHITNLVCTMILSSNKVCYFVMACFVVKLVLTGMFCTC